MRKTLRTFTAAMLCMVLVVISSAIPASAVSQAEIDALEAQRDDIKAQQERVEEQLGSLKMGLDTALEQKSALDEQSELLRQDIAIIDGQIELYDRAIADAYVALERANAEAQAHYSRYCSRIRLMEENSLWSYLSFVLKADSISDLLARVVDVSDIMSFDESAREDYLAARDRASKELDEYERLQRLQKEKQAELAAQKEELEEKLDASSAIIASLEEDISSYYEFYKSSEAEMAEVQAQIDEKAEELRKQQEAEKAAAAQQNKPAPPQNVISGYYMWPSTCTYISSPFGPRVHPIYGQLKPHTGVDIGAWYGTEIYAAASGTVSLAVENYSSVGYGTYVAIYHPNGTTTLYAHMSSLAVYVGQQVTQGQVIGYVGSTGASNGPHIHFEIRCNGTCVDPMLYF